MPIALLALTISAFAIGTTEFVIVGLLPTIAADLGVNLPSAGLLVSLYALGVAVGAPVLTALSGKVPRKTLLLSLMVLFTIGNLLAWKAPGYQSLVAARILTGLAHGVFFSIGSTIATGLVPKEKAASAIAIMFTGLTVALVTGVPLGTFIGQHFGWRETFLAVSALGVVAFIGTFSKVMSPELRLGYAVLPEAILNAVLTVKHLNDWHTASAPQYALAKFIADGSLGRHIRRCSAIYASRRERLQALFAQELAPWFELVPASAGFHVAALCRRPIDLKLLTRLARRSEIGLYPLSNFYAGPVTRPGLLFGYGAIETLDIDVALLRLRDILLQIE